MGAFNFGPSIYNYGGNIDNVSFEIPLGLYQRGPNINYSIELMSNKSDYPNNIDLIVTQIIPSPNYLKYDKSPQQITFQSLFFQQENFYESIIQDSNNYVHTYQCLRKNQGYQCTLQNFIALSGQIILYAQGYTGYEPLWVAVTNDQKNVIQVFNFSCYNFVNIPFPGIIVDIITNANFVFFLYQLQDQTKIIDIYQLVDQSFKKYLTITPPDQIENRYYQAYNKLINNLEQTNYNPIKLIANKGIPDILFIRSLNQILTISISDGIYTLLSILVINPPNNFISTAAWATKNQLIVAFDGPNCQIMEYSIFNLENITPTKAYSLYGWNILQNLSISSSFSETTEQLYFVMQKQQATAIFIFKPGFQLINTLYKVLNLQIQPNQIINLVANGYYMTDVLYLYYFGQQSQQNVQLYYVPVIQSLQINMQLKNDSTPYIQNASMLLSIFGWADNVNPQDQIIYQNQLVRSVQSVTLNQSIINNQLPYLTNSLNISWDTNLPYLQYINDENWYNGQVYSYDINTQNFSTKNYITIQNHVQMVKKQLNNLTVDPQDIFIDPQTQNIYFLSQTQLIGMTQDQMLLFSFNLSNYSVNCIQLVPQYGYNNSQQKMTLQNLTVIYYEFEYINLIILDVSNYYNPKIIFQNIQLEEFYQYQYAQAMYMDGYFLVLALGDFETTANIFIYDVGYGTADLYYIYNAFTLDIGGEKYQSYINFTSFDIWEISQDQRKLIISNNLEGIIIANIQAFNLRNVTDTTFFNIGSFFNQPEIGLTLPLTVQLSKVIVASCILNTTLNNVINMRIFIMMNDIGIYDLILNFNSSSLTNYAFLPQQTSIVQIYSSYGHYQIGSKISIYGQNRVNYQSSFIPTLFAVRFYDPYQFIITLAVYNTQKIGEPGSASPVMNIPIITMLGGYQFNYSVDYWSFAFEFQYNNDQEQLTNSLNQNLATLYSTNPNQLSACQFNIYQYLTLNISEINWVSEVITLIPKSQFLIASTQNVNLPASIFRQEKQDKNNNNGLEWYWILLIVIGSVILFGFIGFLIWTYQQKKKSSYIDLEYSQQNQQSPINDAILNADRA